MISGNSRWLVPLGFLLIFGLLFLSGVHYLNSFREQVLLKTHNVLSAISDNKASLVESWLKERERDAYLIHNNSTLRSLAKSLYLSPNDQQIKQRIANELEVFKTFYAYSFSFFGTHDDLQAYLSEDMLPWENSITKIALSHKSNDIIFTDFLKSTDSDDFLLGMVIPMYHDEMNNEFLSFFMAIKPKEGLFDMVRETHSNNVNIYHYFLFYLQDRLYVLPPALPGQQPEPPVNQNDAMHESVVANLLQDNAGMCHGRGLNDHKVYASLSKIGDTPWMVVAQIDEREVVDSVRQRAIAFIGLAGALLLSFFALVLIFIRKQQLNMLKMSRDNEFLLDDLINNQPSGIYRVILTSETTPKSNKGKSKGPGKPAITYLFVSKQHESITGLSESELKSNPTAIFDVVHPDDRKDFLQKNAESIHRLSHFQWEGRLLVKGKLKWVRFESVPRLTPPKQVIWTGIVVDITLQKNLEQEMERREAFERLLTRLSSSFVNVTTENCNRIIEEALRKIGTFCNSDRAYVFLYNEQQNIVSNSHEWCDAGVVPQKEFLQALPCDEIPNWMNQLRDFKHISFPDVSKLPDTFSVEKSILEPQGVKSLVVVPIISEQKLYGFVGFDSVKQHRNWQDYEIQLLRVFSDLLYNAMERSKWESKLLESQKMLRTVLDTIQVRVFWKDLSLHFEGCNEAFAKDAGMSKPAQLIGLDDFQMPWTDQAEKYRNDDMKVIATGIPMLNFEELQTSPDGTIKWLNTSKIPLLSSQGKIMGVLGTYQDITEQKLAEDALRTSEKRYRTLTENAFDGIYLLRHKSFEYVNQRFCELTGYSFEELTNPEFDNFELFSAESRKIAEFRRIARSSGEELPNTYEMQIITRSGEIKDVEISTNILSNMGEEDLILGIMRDITERKNNEKLRNEVTIANQAANFKQNFLANMSHEIRTPLTGVLGMIEILSKTNLSPEQTDFVNTLRLSTENLREIINQILDYSKIEAGKMNLKPWVFKTNSLFSNAQKLFRATCKSDVKLFLDISNSIPSFIEADEQRISQVINNLLSNAIKFTNQGEITIKADVDKWLNDKELMIKILVVDTGIGIPDDAISRLFSPFEQIEHEDKRWFEGTGLGLSISSELVELMEGEIGVMSAPGKGSTFWFTFKATRAGSDDPKPGKAKKTVIDNANRLRILVAEDKVVNQKVIKIMLKTLGHEVELANNGQQIIDIFKPNEFDLILMDIQMPVLDGIRATQKLRQMYDNLPPIVGLSANAFEGDREKYMKQGLDEYLTKPIKSEDLEKIIQKLDIRKK